MRQWTRYISIVVGLLFSLSPLCSNLFLTFSLPLIKDVNVDEMKREDLPVDLHKIHSFALGNLSSSPSDRYDVVTNRHELDSIAFDAITKKKVSVRTINANVEKKKKKRERNGRKSFA